MIKFHEHRRQFYASRSSEAEHTVPRHWDCIELGKLIVWHCPDLPVHMAVTKDETKVLLLGNAYRILPGSDTPAKELASINECELVSVCENWSGRFILLTDDLAIPDASASLALLYSPDTRAISSSTALLSKTPPVGGEIVYEVGLDFILVPATAARDVLRTPPRHMLHFSKGRWVQKTSTTFKVQAGRNVPEIINDLETALLTTMTAINENETRPIILPLTAGYDSRLLLSAAIKLGLNFSTVTMNNGVQSDIQTAVKLAEIAGVQHTIIEPEIPKQQLKDIWDTHSHGHRPQADRHFFSSGQWAPLTQCLVLRGGGFEVGRCFYYQSLPPYKGCDQGRIFELIKKQFFHPLLHKKQKRNLNSLKIWSDGLVPSDLMAVDYRDLFYIDQRLAGWLSDLEQSLDLTGATRIHVSNSQYIFELLLSLPIEFRLQSLHHRELIRRWTPKLDEITYNPIGKKNSKIALGMRRFRKAIKLIGTLF